MTRVSEDLSGVHGLYCLNTFKGLRLRLGLLLESRGCHGSGKDAFTKPLEPLGLTTHELWRAGGL